jgi:hypothetical protein
MLQPCYEIVEILRKESCGKKILRSDLIAGHTFIYSLHNGASQALTAINE